MDLAFFVLVRELLYGHAISLAFALLWGPQDQPKSWEVTRKLRHHDTEHTEALMGTPGLPAQTVFPDTQEHQILTDSAL